MQTFLKKKTDVFCFRAHIGRGGTVSAASVELARQAVARVDQQHADELKRVIIYKFLFV